MHSGYQKWSVCDLQKLFIHVCSFRVVQNINENIFVLKKFRPMICSLLNATTYFYNKILLIIHFCMLFLCMYIIVLIIYICGISDFIIQSNTQFLQAFASDQYVTISKYFFLLALY